MMQLNALGELKDQVQFTFNPAKLKPLENAPYYEAPKEELLVKDKWIHDMLLERADTELAFTWAIIRAKRALIKHTSLERYVLLDDLKWPGLRIVVNRDPYSIEFKEVPAND